MTNDRKVVNMKYRYMQEAGAPHKIYIYDEITADGSFDWDTWEFKESETSARHMKDLLDGIPAGEEIEIHINSAGGEVSEGVAIYNLIRRKASEGNRTIGYVDGMAYSVAMDIAMACDEIHMGLGTSMFLHYPWTYACGNAEQLVIVAEQLEALGNASVQLYLERANDRLTEEELRQMMARETMLDPDTCLKYGFCDVIDTYRAVQPKPERTDQGEDPAELSRQLREQVELNRQLTEQISQISQNRRKQTISGAAALFRAMKK